jgi:hypothetical protein
MAYPRAGKALLEMWMRWLTLLLFLLIPWATQAAPSPAVRLARDDLALSRLLVCQEREMQVAAQALEDWAAGRLSGDEALVSARRSESRCRNLEEEIHQRALTAEASVAAPARRAARSRVEMVAQLVALLAKGRASRADLMAFNQRQADLAAGSLENWLRGRQAATHRILTMNPPARLAAYYRWQRSLLPLQLEQVSLARQIQKVLAQLAVGRIPRSPKLLARAQELQGRVARLKGDPALEKAVQAVRQEGESLVRLAEAVDLMLGDPGSDSSARVKRFGSMLQKDSARAEEESLEALARSLGD